MDKIRENQQVGLYGWYNLRDAIIKQAAADYEMALKRKKQGAEYNIIEIEKFFLKDIDLYLPDIEITGAEIFAIVKMKCAKKSKRMQRQIKK